jgi:hypothetical protein
VFEKPNDGDGHLITTQDGELGFADVVDVRNLTLWSMETGPEGAMGWSTPGVLDLETLLPGGALSIPKHSMSWRSFVNCFVDGTQVIFVSTYVGCYMLDLKSGRVRRVACLMEKWILPYMRFFFPGNTYSLVHKHLAR